MTARGELYIEYPFARDGTKRDEPLFHPLKTITVRSEQNYVHALTYEIEGAGCLQIFFKADGVEIFNKGGVKIDYFEMPDQGNEGPPSGHI